jgi:hypothetical protein
MQALSTGLNDLFGGMPPTVLAIWGVFVLVMVFGVLAAVLYERRRYAARNKAGAWLFTRFTTLPIAAVTAAAVILPSRAVGGPEALAAFYLLLLIAGPLVYFGLHLFAGYLAGLERKDSLAIALSGLLMALVPVLLAGQSQRWVFDLARAIDGSDGAAGSKFSRGEKKPLLHQVVEQQRFSVLDIGEVWTERWQAPAGVRVERVELEVRGQYVEVDSASSNYLCFNGADVHVFWHGAVAPARWRLHWRGADEVRAYSDWTMGAPAAAAVDFTPEWLGDGFALPVRVPSGMVTYKWMRENGSEDSNSVLGPRLEAGQRAACVQTFRRPVSTAQPQISSLGIRLWRFDTQQMLQALIRRPTAAEGAPAGNPSTNPQTNPPTNPPTNPAGSEQK